MRGEIRACLAPCLAHNRRLPRGSSLRPAPGPRSRLDGARALPGPISEAVMSEADGGDVNRRSDGRVDHRPNGKFAPGNRAASGNPVNRRMYVLRAKLLQAIEPDRIANVGRKLADLAEGGDVA